MKKKKLNYAAYLFYLPFILVGMTLIVSRFDRWVLIIILTFLEYMDICITARALKKKGVEELNPIGRTLQKRFKGFWFVPAVLIFILLVIFVFYSMEIPLLTFIIGFYLCVIINNSKICNSK